MSETAAINVRLDGWTDAADARLTELWEAGYETGEIAQELRCVRGSVWNRRMKIGLISRGIGGPRVSPGKHLNERPCMCCLRPFQSTWIGNRLCVSCKQAA